MKHTGKAILLFAFLVLFTVASVYAQPGNDGPSKKNPPKSGNANYVFGNVKNWKADPTNRYTAPGDYNVVLNASDPVVGETDNRIRFVVVKEGVGKAREFSVSVLANDVAHLLLSSKDAFHDANGFYFSFAAKELGPLPKGKHKLMLVIDRGKTTLVRSEKNQHSVDFIKK